MLVLPLSTHDDPLCAMIDGHSAVDQKKEWMVVERQSVCVCVCICVFVCVFVGFCRSIVYYTRVHINCSFMFGFLFVSRVVLKSKWAKVNESFSACQRHVWSIPTLRWSNSSCGPDLKPACPVRFLFTPTLFCQHVWLTSCPFVLVLLFSFLSLGV